MFAAIAAASDWPTATTALLQHQLLLLPPQPPPLSPPLLLNGDNFSLSSHSAPSLRVFGSLLNEIIIYITVIHNRLTR